MSAEILLETADGLVKVVQLSLEMCCVVVALALVTRGHVHRRECSAQTIGRVSGVLKVGRRLEAG